ncbi:DUF1838 family protein [Novosphingobium sp. CCH12-A3]|uniref:DUF1838 family protein n=1 Tax=Novosphingobium sp. CCH12-A3 TaxID=1768752 RepID=UPI0007802D53|nr:DUF1838 family protein [Novosphingobium sp. CCH12-A3]
MIDRRNVLTGLSVTGSLLAAPLAARSTGVKGDGVLDVSSAEGRLRNFIMMRGALDEGLITSWVSARYYGVVEDRMDPLFAVVSAVWSRYRQVADGFEAVNFELAWFTDPLTGKALETWDNPYTGKTCKVPTGGMPPSKIRFGKDLSFHIAREIPGLQMEHDVLPFDVRGDDVWVTERSRTAITFPGAAKPFRYSESNTFHARRHDLARPGATRVTSEVSFTNVCSWRPWMEMGDRPGHLTATGIGRQNASPDSLPPAFVAATQERRPEMLTNPGAILQPLWDAKG